MTIKFELQLEIDQNSISQEEGEAMREYKFCGQSIESREWIYGSLDLSENEVKIRTHDKTVSYNAKLVDPETVGQFIEIYDKNGKEIYEGDWVEIKNPECQVQKAILQGVIVFRYGSFGINIKKVIQWDGYSKGIEPPEMMWFLNIIYNKTIEIVDNSSRKSRTL